MSLTASLVSLHFYSFNLTGLVHIIISFQTTSCVASVTLTRSCVVVCFPAATMCKDNELHEFGAGVVMVAAALPRMRDEHPHFCAPLRATARAHQTTQTLPSPPAPVWICMVWQQEAGADQGRSQMRLVISDKEHNGHSCFQRPRHHCFWDDWGVCNGHSSWNVCLVSH